MMSWTRSRAPWMALGFAAVLAVDAGAQSGVAGGVRVSAERAARAELLAARELERDAARAGRPMRDVGSYNFV